MPRPVTSAERALGELRELILGGALTPGTRLGEVELAERLGVSRTPVREALSRLAAEGLVEISPNRGARVATWTVAELEGVFDLRISLEPQLTAFAVPNAAAADVEELDELAHRIAPDLPLDYRLLASGHFAEYAYDQNALTPGVPYAVLQQRGHINARARQADVDGSDFSRAIRVGVPGMR